MRESDKDDILVMAVFLVTRDDVRDCAQESGISEEQISDRVIELVKEKVSQSVGELREVVKTMVKEAVNEDTINRCPLGLVCSASCVWQEVGGCTIPRGVK